MSAEPLPTPAAPAPRARRAEGFTRAMLGRPVLSLVPTPTRARRAPFVALILGILLLGLIGLLLLNTASAQDAFRLHRLQISAANVNDDRQALSDQVNQLTGPAGLATEAQKLGMDPIAEPAFWKPGEPLPPGARVVDGIVVIPAAAPAGPAPSAAPAVPVNPADATVTSMPRPGQKAPAPKPDPKATKPSTSTGASTKPSAKPSTGGSGRLTPEARATTKPAPSKPTASKPATKPSATGTSGTGR